MITPKFDDHIPSRYDLIAPVADGNQKWLVNDVDDRPGQVVSLSVQRIRVNRFMSEVSEISASDFKCYRWLGLVSSEVIRTPAVPRGWTSDRVAWTLLAIIDFKTATGQPVRAHLASP